MRGIKKIGQIDNNFTGRKKKNSFIKNIEKRKTTNTCIDKTTSKKLKKRIT